MNLLNLNRRIREPQPTNGVPRVGVSTPSGVESTRGTTVVSSPFFFKLMFCGRIYDPGMILYPPRVRLAPRTTANQQSAHYPPRVPLVSRTPTNQQSVTGIGVSTSCEAVSWITVRFRPLFVGVVHDVYMGGFKIRGWHPNLHG